jgi:hypothetical protein
MRGILDSWIAHGQPLCNEFLVDTKCLRTCHGYLPC